MTGDLSISSTANPRIKELVRLRQRRHRDASGRFLVEGFRELRRAIDGGIDLAELYICPELFLLGNEPDLIDDARMRGAEVIDVSAPAFRKASYRDRPEGLLGVAHRFDTSLERLHPTGTPLLLVVEGIEKPGNLGTMLRTADAAGADGVIVCDPTTDPFNPNVVRASIGTLFVVPLAVTGSEQAIGWLGRAGIAAVAATPAGDAAHWQADYTGPTALVIGSEQYGLSDLWLEKADRRVRIPMAGRSDSLNAAMAAGVLLFEAVRQRAAG